jgi:AcrR family transcriptional regulator
MKTAEAESKKKRGRPRLFDRDKALDEALLLFRARGYEGTTLPDLLEVMGGITPPSFYAAFGSKEELFRLAVKRYQETIGHTTACALTEEGVATRDAIEGMLRAAVLSFTRPNEPRGCFLVLGAMSCKELSTATEEELQGVRVGVRHMITKRIRRGIAEGDVPKRVDAGALGSFFATVVHGMSIQARDGASRESLSAAAECAMASWDALARR